MNNIKIVIPYTTYNRLVALSPYQISMEDLLRQIFRENAHRVIEICCEDQK